MHHSIFGNRCPNWRNSCLCAVWSVTFIVLQGELSVCVNDRCVQAQFLWGGCFSFNSVTEGFTKCRFLAFRPCNSIAITRLLVDRQVLEEGLTEKFLVCKFQCANLQRIALVRRLDMLFSRTTFEKLWKWGDCCFRNWEWVISTLIVKLNVIAICSQAYISNEVVIGKTAKKDGCLLAI